ncbi:MAG: GDP-mannose 4,6-dehydratase [Thermoproteus sp.]
MIVVTGGAGFIGSHVAVELKRRGHEVVAVDNLERAKAADLLEREGVPLVVADVRTGEIPRGEAYIHAAAYIDVEESWQRPFEYAVNNAAATLRLAKKAWEERAFFVYISSAAVYGEPRRLPIDENHPTEPISPYGLTKLWGEHAVALYGRAGLKYAVVRPFNVYGPRQSGPYAGVITKFVERARAGLPPVIYGDGEQTRDFIHVEDVAKLVAAITEKKAEGVYNAGTGKATSINQLARLVMRLAGVEGEPLYAPPRPGDVRHSVADIKKVRSLGWEPRVELEEGIKRLLATPIQ